MLRPRRTQLLLATGVALAVNHGCHPSTALLGSYSEGGQASGGRTSDAGNSATGGIVVGGTTTRTGLPTFTAAVAIDSVYVTGKTVTDPAVRGDGLELYFMSTASGNKSIWRSVRALVSDAWGDPVFVDELNTDAEEQNPRLSEDGLRLWFYTDRARAQGTIWEATRSSTTGTFGEPRPVPGVSTGERSDVSAAFNREATIAIVSTLVSTPLGYELLEWRRTATNENFTDGVGLATVNSEFDDFDPWLSSDGLVLIFHSNRAGNDDLFWTSRATTADDFGEPQPLSELNSTTSDTAPSLTANHRRLVFASTRDGDERLYEAIAVE